MIIYAPEPLELYQLKHENNNITAKLSSGGYVVMQPVEYNKLRVVSVCSTDPMDYLNDKLQPGNIISMQTMLEN